MVLASLNLSEALGSSILAFIMGVLIGIAVGYIIWADRVDDEPE